MVTSVHLIAAVRPAGRRSPLRSPSDRRYSVAVSSKILRMGAGVLMSRSSLPQSCARCSTSITASHAASSKKRDVAEIHDDAEPHQTADQVVERPDRRHVEAPGQAEVGGAVQRLDTNGEGARGKYHPGSLPGGLSPSVQGAGL